MTPERFNDLLLDYVYDLLDEGEAREVRAFVDGNPQARMQMERARSLLAGAARHEFPSVQFSAPNTSEVQPASTVKASASNLRLVRWIVAAALLIAVSAAAYPIARHVGGYISAQRSYASAEREIDQTVAERRALVESRASQLKTANDAVKEAENAIVMADAAFQQELERAAKELNEKQVVLEVVGPKAIQPGAPNQFHISTRSKTDMANVPSRLHIRVLDGDKVVFEEKDAQSQGTHVLLLPPDLPYKPKSQLSLDITAVTQGQVRGELTESLKWAAPRYVTHLATDKPMYQPGEMVRFRSLTLNRANLTPPDEDFHVVFQIIGPKGEVVFSAEGESRLRMQVPGKADAILSGPDGKPVRGVGAAEFHIADYLEGGEYTLTVREMMGRFPEEKRKFLVNKYTPDLLVKELDFDKTSYGAGDLVVANCKVSHAARGPLVNSAVVNVVAQVDGQMIAGQARGVTDAFGRVQVQAKLPAKIDIGKATLTVTFSDSGVTDSIQKPIPIIVNKMFVEFFPEGGDLIAGLTNRVYFQARTTLDKPADLKGRLLDSKNVEVARVETVNDEREPGANQGLGVFSFTPQAGEKYSLQIDQPTGIVDRIPLLQGRVQLKPDGVVLSVPGGVSGGVEPIRVELQGTKNTRNMLVGAYSRGRLLDHQRVTLEAGKKAVVELKPVEIPGGVVRITAFEEQNGQGTRPTFIPLAERLVFRKSPKAVRFTIEPNRSRFAPGDPVSLTITAQDEAGNPARAIAMIGVVNDAVVKMADEKTARNLNTHFALVGEVKKPEDLEHADFLLGEHPKSAVVLDMLLGVQGWRRFAEQSPVEFRNKNQQNAVEAEQLLILSGQDGDRLVNTLNQKQAEINQAYAAKSRELGERLERAMTNLEAVKPGGDFDKSLAAKNAEVREKDQAYQVAAAAIRPFDDTHNAIRRNALPVLSAVALALALGLVLIGVVVGAKRAVPYHVAAAGSLAAALVLLASSTLNIDEVDRGGKVVAFNVESPALPNPNADAMPQMAAEGMVPGKAEPARDGAKFAQPPAMPPAPPMGGGRGGAQLKPNDFAKDDPAGRALPRAMAMDKGGERDDRNRFAEKGPKPGLPADMMKFRPNVPANVRRFNQPAGDGKPELEMMKKALDRKAKGDVRLQEFGGARGPMGGGGFGNRAGGIPMGPGGPMGGFGRPGGGPGAGFGGGPGFPGQMPPGAMVMPPADPFFVREFAFTNVKTDVSVRSEMAETVFWSPAVVLDETGKKTVTFQLGDSITTYRVLVAGHTLEGRLGQGTHFVEARKPFSVETTLPVEMTSNDRLDLSIIATNDTDDQRPADITIEKSDFQLLGGSAQQRLMLGKGEGKRRIFSMKPSIMEGQAKLNLSGKCEPFAQDQLTRTIPIVPEGFPVVGSASDLLEKVARHELTLPTDYVRGTLKLQAQIYPSTLADLQKGLEGLLREPSGCFEQTSTTNYPNTLILNYLNESGDKNPEAAKRARELLERGYQKLISFECQKLAGGQGREGYEWFGGAAPPHEALTAYGLLQFKDMAKVHPVDAEMLERTRNYLLSRRKPEGGFERNARALDTFGRAPQHITDAYILWALTETGKEDFTKDIEKLLKDYPTSNDPYFLALLGNALLNSEGAEQRQKGIELLKKIMKKQAEDGGLDGAITSITCSGDRDLRIETTAIAILGWLKANQPADFTAPLNKAIKWIGQQRGGHGAFGSTQSTILALKALIAFTTASKMTAEPGELILYVGDEVVGRNAFQPGVKDAVTIEVKDPEKVIKAGKNQLRLELVSKRSYPYTIAWSYSTLTPVSSEKCQVRLSTKLNKNQAKEGENVRLTATLENVAEAGKGLPMTVAVIGLPAGLKAPEDMKQLIQMAALRKTGPNGELQEGEISFFEIRGRELVLYWRQMKPGQKIEVSIDLIAYIPGEFRGPASRAYLYYTADHKSWTNPLQVGVEAKAE